MKVHFIAIGGSAMHNLAIALSRKGYLVTGSDDEIFEPSRTRLEKQGILPPEIGWFPDKISKDLDAVILGMHARNDNSELIKAKELGLPIYSYPEYLYEQSKDKKRLVVGGSHGKTTITSMLLHVAKELQVNVDYMVGAQLEGYDCMVKLSEDAPFIILEGDEYLSSPIDLRPKFHLYKPHVAILSGIAWDHINVFPTFDNYVDQFRVFCELIETGGTLIYNEEDEALGKVAAELKKDIRITPYKTPEYMVVPEGSVLTFENNTYPLQIFGAHNLQNAFAAMHMAKELGITPAQFFEALKSFKGAGKRLQKVVSNSFFNMFKDFAHSPSKLKATTKAVKEQYQNRKLIACMELHTFSSLKKDFLPHYKDAMIMADVALVYFSPEVVKHKKLEPISKEMVADGFGGNVIVYNDTHEVLEFLRNQEWKNSTLLMMSSGNFDGINYDELGEELIAKM